MNTNDFKFYSVYDSALEEFMNPFCAKNDKIAVRIFEAAKKQENIILDDLTLYSIGSFSINHAVGTCAPFCDYRALAQFVNGNMIQLDEAKANE